MPQSELCGMLRADIGVYIGLSREYLYGNEVNNKIMLTCGKSRWPSTLSNKSFFSHELVQV